MLFRGEYLTAFEILKETFRILNMVEMDGSSGEHGIIAMAIKDYMERAIRECDSSSRSAMYKWFRDNSYGQSGFDIDDIIDDIYETAFNEEEYLLQLLQETREKVNQYCKDDGYYLKHFLWLYSDVFYLFIFIKSIWKELFGLTGRFSYLRLIYDGTDLFPVILEFRRQSWWGGSYIPDTRITEWPTTANCYLSRLLFPYTLDII